MVNCLGFLFNDDNLSKYSKYMNINIFCNLIQVFFKFFMINLTQSYKH